MEKREVAVIGAGAAGIAAARRLAEAGRRVVVFEKSRGFGGRCATRRWEGQVIDHGAQYVTARDPLFRQRLQEACGDALRPLEAPVVIETGERLLTDQRWYHADGNSRLVGELARGLDVRLSSPVDRIGSAGGEWLVAGERFGTVISTAPLPQTLALAGRPGAGSGTYVPCLTAVLWFDGEGLGRTREIYAISDRSGHALAWSACENHKAGRITPGVTALVVQASRDFSERHLDRDPAEWSAELARLAAERWGIPLERWTATQSHRWRYARVEAPVTVPALPAGIVYAGDATGGSRVESAWRAGWDAAGGVMGSGTA